MATVPITRHSWRIPLHPFMLAAASVLGLFAVNAKEASFPDVLPMLFFAVGVAAASVLVLAVILRSTGTRVGLLTTIMVFGCLYSRRFALWVVDQVGGVSFELVMILVGLGTFLLFVLVLRLRSDLRLAQSVVGGITFIMMTAPVAQVAWYWWHTDRPDLAVALPEEQPQTLVEQPDIYYLIFDRYTSAAALRKYFSIDTAEMQKFLEDQKFYIAADSHANYLKTGHSLASTFQMNYLRMPEDEKARKSSDWAPIHRMLRNHQVGNLFKAAGYKYVQIGSWWAPTQVNPGADVNPQFGFGEFSTIYLRDAGLYPLANLIAPDSHYTSSLRWDSGQCQRIPWQVEQIKKAASGQQPTFVFAHILLPHEPFVFDRDGRCLTEKESGQRGRLKGYVDQVHYANTVIKDLVTSLQARSSKQPVIIIQGDEGPFPETDVGHTRSWADATIEELDIKLSILSSFYFPDQDYSLLYGGMTPVNSFRVISNKYLHSKLEMLPDHIYGFPNIFQLYNFFQINIPDSGSID